MAAQTIRVVVYQRGETWIAQALEIDVATQERSFNRVLKKLVEEIAAAHEYTCRKFGKPFFGMEQAPHEFQEMFDQAAGNEDVEIDISPRITRPEFPTMQPHIAARILEAAA